MLFDFKTLAKTAMNRYMNSSDILSNIVLENVQTQMPVGTQNQEHG